MIQRSQLAVEDAGGEPVRRRETVVRHGRELTIMTTGPTHIGQLKLLAQESISHPTADMPLPGSVKAVAFLEPSTSPELRSVCTAEL
jgi:hypothetical protein